MSYAFAYPFWDFTLGVNSDALFDQGGVNIPFASFGVSVGVRRTFLGDGDLHEGHRHGAHHGQERP